MVEVVVTKEFKGWYGSLEDKRLDAVNASVDLLEVKGTSLSFPKSSAIKGSRYALRELRVQSHGKPLRIFYIFDPKRQAVLLVGGDKTGDNRFYETMVPKAEAAWEAYLKELDHG